MPAQLSAPVPDDEPALHFYARESQTLLRWMVRILLVVTLLTMITFWFWAIIPAMLLIVAYLALLLTNAVEHGSDRRSPAPAEGPQAAPARSRPAEPTPAAREDGVSPIVSMRLLEHETKVIAAGILAILIIASVMAALFFGGIAWVVAVPFVFAYIAFIAWPVWLAAIEDDLEDTPIE